MGSVEKFALGVDMRFFLILFMAVLLLSGSANVTSAPKAQVGDRFGDWVLECRAIAAGSTNCSLTQTLVDKNSKKAIARFTLSRSGEKSQDILFNAFLPLGIDIPAGVSLAIDGAKPRSLLLKTCTRRGCVAQYKIDKNLLNVFKKGKGFVVSFNSLVAKKKVNLGGSLSGISAGVKASGLE